MPERGPEFWERAQRAQQKLITQFLDHEDVILIDIGYATETEEMEEPPVVLRMHVRPHWFKRKAEERTKFPDTIDGIPIVIIPGAYHF